MYVLGRTSMQLSTNSRAFTYCRYICFTNSNDAHTRGTFYLLYAFLLLHNFAHRNVLLHVYGSVNVLNIKSSIQNQGLTRERESTTQRLEPPRVICSLC